MNYVRLPVLIIAQADQNDVVKPHSVLNTSAPHTATEHAQPWLSVKAMRSESPTAKHFHNLSILLSVIVPKQYVF